MDALRIEFVFTPDQLCQLNDMIKKCVVDALNDHSNTIRSQKVNLTKMEAAATLRFSTRKLDRLLKKGLIKYHRIGNRILIPESEIESFLKQSA
jgi:excisionase family DNA binding protein